MLGTFFDGIARHTEEGHAFVRRAAESGFREAVRERDEPFGDHGLDGFGVELDGAAPMRDLSQRHDHAGERPGSSSPAASRATSGSSRWRSRTTHARGRIVVDRRHLHPGGFVHGGAWTALGDTVAAWATFRSIPPGHDFTTIELKLNVFGSGLPGDEIVAVASRCTSAAPRS